MNKQATERLLPIVLNRRPQFCASSCEDRRLNPEEEIVLFQTPAMTLFKPLYCRGGHHYQVFQSPPGSISNLHFIIHLRYGSDSDPFPVQSPPTYQTRPGQRIIDDHPLPWLLQLLEIVGKKLFRWLHLQKTLKIDVKFFEKTSENIEKQYLNQCFTKKKYSYLLAILSHFNQIILGITLSTIIVCTNYCNSQ